MRLINMRRSASLNRNHYFVFGLLFGLALSFYIPQNIWELVQQEECPQQAAEYSFIRKFGEDFEPHLNLINKPLAAKKPVKNVVRPRYYSSELGIREKIFIGVMTSQESINSLATAINRTTAHLVDRIKFFINAEDVKNNYKLKNIVGFTDPREILRPFHVIKYISDNYLDDYDYFLIIPDTVYVDARKLKLMLYHFSITFDLYMGTRLIDDKQQHQQAVENEQIHDYDDEERRLLNGEHNYCDLNAGILLSSGVLRKIRNNLDWCVRNGNSNVHSVNIGRCVKYSSKLAGCQQSFQGIVHRSYELQHNERNIYKELNHLSQKKSFRNATTIFPITIADDFYRLHAYFSKHHLEMVQIHSLELERKAYSIANGTISNNILEIRWPLGVQLPSTPETRHDIINWALLNETHQFVASTENAIEALSTQDADDFKRVLKIAQEYAAQKHSKWSYVSVHTAYKRFDATRGMDYQLHLNFRDSWGQMQLISLQVIKPLGRVEIIPSPYVTESTRIAILVPTYEHRVTDALHFIEQYERVCMSNQDNTFLLMIFLYRYNSESKGDLDPFKHVKTVALDLSAKYKADGSRVAWVSIRLPTYYSRPFSSDDMMLTSLYGANEHLSIAVTDLALPKIGLETLVLMASPTITFKTDFLNRVRMNTIQGFQVYSPVGFMMYPCKLAYFCKECESCDVSQGTGYFDKCNYDVVSFYSRDYVQARKRVELLLPIIRSDTDIEQLNTRIDKSIITIVDMFVSSQLPVHILRGMEPNLRFGNSIRNYFETYAGDLNDESAAIPKCPAFSAEDNLYNMASNELPQINNLKCIHLASRKQIGDAIIRYEDKSIVHK